MLDAVEDDDNDADSRRLAKRGERGKGKRGGKEEEEEEEEKQGREETATNRFKRARKNHSNISIKTE